MGRFFGIGVDKYQHHRDLRHAVSDIAAFAELLGEGFTCSSLENPTEGVARDRLQELEGTAQGEELVVLWAGHGIGSPSGLRVLAGNSRTGPTAGINATDVASYCAESGASQLLLILDTCHSGDALDAGAVAVKVLEDLPQENRHMWVGVLASCMGIETAQDGLLGQRLRPLLDKGPTDPMLRLRWSVHNSRIRGDDLCDALIKEWASDRQTPQFQSRGSAWWMFRNPRYDPGAPEQVVEHLLRAARGGPLEDERSWFTGRTLEVNQVVSWIRAGQPGMYVITGSAGTGKSAITGRVVSLANREERQRLFASGDRWEHENPDEGSVHANVHARGLATDQVAAQISGQLIGQGVLEAQENPRNAAELVGHLQRVVRDGAPPPVIVVDGLDEARGEAFKIAEHLVQLAEHSVLVVSTRDIPGPEGDTRLVSKLSPTGPAIDLDTPEAQERTRGDLRDYVARRLDQPAARQVMEPTAVADRVAAGSAVEESPFLLGRLIIDQLLAAPIDTAKAGWQEEIAFSVAQAFDRDIAGIEAPEQRRNSQLARTLLVALTRGYGAGLPEDEWLAIANVDAAASREDVSWVLNHLGRYIVQDGEDGTAVYRLAHQSLADHLRPSFCPSPKAVFDPKAPAIMVALAALHLASVTSERRLDTSAYRRRHLWRHSIDAGLDGLDILRDLAAIDGTVTADVASSGVVISGRLNEWGLRQLAVAPIEEAVGIYRKLSTDNPAILPTLAGALNNLGVNYNGIGRLTDAITPTEEAVGIYRKLSTDNPAYLPNLASALNNLGVNYNGIGRLTEAIAPTEEAVALRRKLSIDNPAYFPDLAGALNNLGIRYSDVGRRTDAITPTEEAVGICRKLSADNPAFFPDLAMALTNLGSRYSEVGRRADAITPTEEAVALRRKLSTDNPAFLPDLAGALNNLGVSYSEVGRLTEAITPTEEAVGIYRQLGTDNAAFLPDLAGTLSNLSIRYSEVGRLTDAITPTEEALAIYRKLTADNPAFLPNLAMVLNNLGSHYSGIGRLTDAIAPTEEAVALRRKLSTDNPAFLPNLAGALNNLGIRYSEVGRLTDAITPTEEAVGICRKLSTDNPAFFPNLASALTWA
ncbi:tetratricopeptide repeat protein [Actinoplanes sp. NPDC024001]|uniref:tetratricopeptide repeat protein n=1 Tax=Actinoplanes sp. NPDC024001 TaxID=3154598 RepID=UPI0033F7410A